jgi:hypothetical protein
MSFKHNESDKRTDNGINSECNRDEEVEVKDNVSNADVEDRPHNEEDLDDELDVSVLLKTLCGHRLMVNRRIL